MSVFLVQALIMIVIYHVSNLPAWFVVLFDSSMMVLILFPMLYMFVFRPMVRHTNEREKSEQALYESKQRYETVFRTSPDAITVSRLDDGLIIEVNEGFTALSQYSEKEVIGRTSFDIGVWHDPQNREEMVTRLQKDGYLKNFEAEFIRKDGVVIDVLLSANVIMLNDELHMLAVSRDITQWKKAQKILQVSHRFLQISNRYKEMNPLLTKFISVIKEMTNCSAVGIRILDEDGKIPYQAFEGFSQQFYESENPKTLDSANCMCARVILQKTDLHQPYFTEGGSFLVNSTTGFIETLSNEQKARICSVCNMHGYESVALIPIYLGDKVLGLIQVVDPQENMFSERTIETLEDAALQLGIALKRVRSEEALKESHQALERKVAVRTAMLASANELLKLEIEERKLSEKKLLKQQEKLRSLSSELVLTEERERRRIATDLHDRIGQTLAVTKIKLGELREASASSEAGAKALDEIQQYIEETIQDTRSLTFELSTPVLYVLGLEAALAWLANQTREKHGLQIEVKDDGKPKPLDNGCRVIAYQAARELLFNIVKHAQAKSATVSIKKYDDAVRIDIEDNGIGFDTAELDTIASDPKGFGLFSIQERFHALGGRLEIHSEPGRGTLVSLMLPMDRHAQDSGD